MCISVLSYPIPHDSTEVNRISRSAEGHEISFKERGKTVNIIVMALSKTHLIVFRLVPKGRERMSKRTVLLELSYLINRYQVCRGTVRVADISQTGPTSDYILLLYTTQITQKEQMIKSTNHLAFPSLLIKCAGLLAPNQLELLQEQQGQEQTGGLFLYGVFVFSWFAGSLSRLLQVTFGHK